MTVFLSHSHADQDVVERISHYLVANNIKVWKDTWKLPPGEALTEGVIEAIRNASYFCIVLSKESVRSEWVAKELHAALRRDRKGGDNFLLPLLVETCEIPAALQDVIQIDLREDFEAGMKTLLGYVGRKYNWNLSGRLEDGKDFWFDWLIQVQEDHGRIVVELDMVAHDLEATYSNVAHIRVSGDDFATLEALEVQHERAAIAHALEMLIGHYAGSAGTLILVGNSVKEDHCVLVDPIGRATFTADVRVVRLGQVPKNVQLFPLQEHLKQICKDSIGLC